MVEGMAEIAGGNGGKSVSILLYRAIAWAAAPLVAWHIRRRRNRGLEHPLRWEERFGRPSIKRPNGPLLWFHAVSLGEGMAAIPVIEQCIQARPYLSILMTTSTVTAFSVLQYKLPKGVICQFAPIDIPPAVDAFLRHWHPDAAIFLESELWPNLLLAASGSGVILALLNARMSAKSFRRWSTAPARPVIAAMLSRLSLIVPLNTHEAVHFQLLGAPPFVINFAGNLKYASGTVNDSIGVNIAMEELAVQLSGRKVWMASSTHEGEEDGELRDLYRLSPIAVIGGSFLPGLAGHNIAEAAAAGCAVLTGPYIGHFAQMVAEMQRSVPSSVQQVSGKGELLGALQHLLDDIKCLEAHREAAKQASLTVAVGVLQRVWHLLDTLVLTKAFGKVATLCDLLVDDRTF